ncbi:M20 family metallopeptidase [Leptolyngbya sp. FACHB-261]|uniref:M20 family metallopeptidase n=1 Tax=Leptolyngbya sp. FACHB-261 TaxID=2692806 RepID=UPI001684A0F8|nr:M20 family metallopeptidase [Leptolyngbya sp. FACHB-261]MBD2104955.1 M20 family metallopeptidase [Leptolyngbya sp. FACHB-261]
MKPLLNSLQFTQDLLRFNTMNPPGQEDECVRFIGGLLEDLGFSTNYYAYAEGRTSLVAKLRGDKSYLPLCLTGHIDTVPLGTSQWQKEPFNGETDGDVLYGRGTSDMKSGVAAMIFAAKEIASASRGNANLTLIFTAGEETCCAGAYHLAEQPGALGEAGAIVVGEPTANYPLIGHKGAVRFAIRTSGVTAHASTPELGDNAIYKAARASLQLEQFNFGIAPHSFLGEPTLNVGTISGGQNINSVPDQAIIGVDIRTIPGLDHQDIREQLQQLLGREVEVNIINEATSVVSDVKHDWIQQVFSITRSVTGQEARAAGATFFSDASVFTPAYNFSPTIILGPGEPSMAHKTDEYCHISKLEQSIEIYALIVRQWCGV